MPQPHGGSLQRGGPGRPKGSISLTRLLEDKLKEGDTAKDVIKWTLDQAKLGNAAALKILWDRIDGPIITKVELDDVSNLTPAERDARVDQLFNAGRARAIGSAVVIDTKEGD